MDFFMISLKEEYTKFIRDRKLIFIVAVMPFIAAFFLSYLYAPGVIKHISTAVVDLDNTALSRQVVEFFRNNETFDVKYELLDEQEIFPLIRAGKIDFAICIPENFQKDIKELKGANVLAVADASNMSVSSIGIEKATEILATLSAGTSVTYLEAKGVPPEKAENYAVGLPFEKRIWYNPARNYATFMMPGFIAALFQIGIVMGGAVSVNTSEWREQLRELKLAEKCRFLLGKAVFYAGIGVLLLNIYYLIQITLFGLGIKGNFFRILLLSVPFALTVAMLGVLTSVIFKWKVYSSEISMFFIVPSMIYSGYTWPILAMPVPLQVLARLVPFYYFADTAKTVLTTSAPIPNYFFNFCMLWLYFGVLFAAAVLLLVFEPAIEKMKGELAARFKANRPFSGVKA